MSAKKGSLKENESPSGNTKRSRRGRKRVDEEESQAAFVAEELPGGGKGSKGRGKDQLQGIAPHGALQEGVGANLMNRTNGSLSGNAGRSRKAKTANLLMNFPGLSVTPMPGNAPLPRHCQLKFMQLLLF